MTQVDLGWLWDVLDSRRDAPPESSYTARLLSEGPDRIGRKVGEEAAETIIAGIRADAGGDRAEVIAESADLIYHLLVFMMSTGVSLEDVAEELARRHSQS
jgi:phosphoribosyl-ATP pyrophosphohydrolase